jgi:phosphocarrier protein
MSEPASGGGDPSGRPQSGDALVRVLEIVNKKGLHARAAAKFVQAAEQFDAQVQVASDGEPVDGTSILDLLMLGAATGTSITVTTTGPQAGEAMETLISLVESGFGEED